MMKFYGLDRVHLLKWFKLKLLKLNFSIADQDEEKGCWNLALWVLQEDSGWRCLDV